MGGFVEILKVSAQSKLVLVADDDETIERWAARLGIADPLVIRRPPRREDWALYQGMRAAIVPARRLPEWLQPDWLAEPETMLWLDGDTGTIIQSAI